MLIGLMQEVINIMVLFIIINLDPKILRLSFCTFPETCLTVQERFVYLRSQQPMSIEEKTYLGLVPFPSDVKLHDGIKKPFIEEDTILQTVPKRAFNAIYLAGEFFPNNTV
jgi:hypothetical protein